MFGRIIWTTSGFVRTTASQSAACVLFVRDTINGFLTTAHHTLMALGIIAIGTLALMFVKPELADHLQELSPFAEASAEEADEEVAYTNVLDDVPTGGAMASVATEADSARQQQWVTTWLSKRYRVANDATNMLVSAAYVTAKEIKLDPLLILSVMAIESGFNPFAESPVGAQGLMQVMSKVHHDKFQELGGVKAALNPVANIKVGSLILKDYVQRGGSVEAGLKLYVGAGASDSDAGYGAKVLAEYRRLKEVAMGKKVPVFTTSASIKPRPQERKEPVEESASIKRTETLAQADKAPAL